MLYGGNVLGKFEELVPEKRIQQSWRLKSWSSGHYSNVVIKLEETVSGSILHKQHIIYICRCGSVLGHAGSRIALIGHSLKLL